MLDESLLDAPANLARADHRGLLRGAAEAGALVRTGIRNASEAGILALRPEGRPRAVLVAAAGAGPTTVADLLDALAGSACPVVRLTPTGVAAAAGALRWNLPGWAGPVDLLLIVTPDGSEPGLALLAEQAYRRGCTVVAVTPRGAPLTETVDGARGLAVPMATSNTSYGSTSYGSTSLGPTAYGSESNEPTEPTPYAPDRDRRTPYEQDATTPGTLWGLLVPLLLLFDATGLYTAPADALQKVADRLDRAAERCGPAVVTYSNPAKSLAVELDEALPLIWTEGQAAGPVGRRFAALLAALPGRPALAAELPEALTAHEALLAAPAGENDSDSHLDDFFRDRVDDASLRPRAVLLRDRPSGGLSAAPAARELAHGHAVPISELEPQEGSDLEALAELIALTDFTAAYLSLGAATDKTPDDLP
ncbi:SIS domain-containing protein [Streptomyces tsukubensis]|uniref:Mannose-6-phosphate isomerase n=1 Tax=Streptomyces tsukubensis TaxID=83656 RepID=A0A1V3ZZG9_9ACTN|nr:SIS domain-containing protein [Streptomyces tsukubensis]OON71305.1 mannose-6-phosphate isomerase [Streptomyces tsukubensis]QFR93941.1 mannose-6-phosphate isomerase [Streptomyces tsukubensis]